MKALPLILAINLSLYLHTSAQNKIKFEENKASQNLADLFLFSYQPDSLVKDSFQVTYYSTLLQKEVRQYLLIYNKNNQALYVADSTECECYKKKKTGDQLIVTLYEVQDTASILLRIFTVTVTPPTKKTPGQLIKVKGQIRSENYLSDGYFDYQSVPRTYSRTSVDMQLAVRDLPFRTGFFYTTESNTMNSFYFSFDHVQYKNNLLKKIHEKKKELPGDISLQEKINLVERDKYEINNSISSPSYQLKLAESRRELEYGVNDSAFRKTRRYKKAESFLRTDSLKRVDLKHLEQLKEKLAFEEYSRNPAFYPLDMVNDDKKLKENLGKYKIKQPGFGWISSIKRFDIGTFTPGYNSLILDAIQVTGINAELNKGIAYGAVCLGDIKSGYVNGGAEEAYRSTIMAGRAGIKKEGKYSLVFTGLKGNGRSYFFNTGANTPYLTNQVLGAEATYYLGKSIGFRGELATSEMETQQARPYETGTGKPGKQYEPSFSSAALFSLFYHSENERTQGELIYQQTGPGYFSIATPYLRKDNRRTELKLNQRVYKNQVSIFGSARLESDNIFDTKGSTTYTTILTAGIKLMPVKMPYLVFSYSPLWQHTQPAPSISITNRMNLYSITSGYTLSGKQLANTTIVNYVRNSTYLLNIDLNSQLFVMNTFMLSNIIQYKPSQTQLSITATAMNHMMSGYNNDSLTFTNSKGLDVMMSQKIKRINSTLEGGYSYITFIPNSYRHGAKLGISTQFAGFTWSLRAERYVISKPTESSLIHVFRITLVKSF